MQWEERGHRFRAARHRRRMDSLYSSAHGIPLEVITRVVGHSGTATTEAVYRKQLRPVITEGAGAMEIFTLGEEGEQEMA